MLEINSSGEKVADELDATQLRFIERSDGTVLMTVTTPTWVVEVDFAPRAVRQITEWFRSGDS